MLGSSILVRLHADLAILKGLNSYNLVAMASRTHIHPHEKLPTREIMIIFAIRPAIITNYYKSSYVRECYSSWKANDRQESKYNKHIVHYSDQV